MTERDKVELEVYKDKCSQCPYSKACHESCTTCEDFDNALLKAFKDKNLGGLDW